MSNQGRRFANEDDEAQYYLQVLRDGSREEKIEARDRLSFIFERRDMLEEACKLAEGNARVGVRDRAMFTRLSSLYRRLGRHDDADAAMAEAASLLGSAPRSPAEPPSAPAVRSAPRQTEPPPSQPVYVTVAPQKKGGFVRTMTIGCLGCAGLLVLLGILGFALGGAALRGGGSTTASNAPAKPGAEPTAVSKVGDTIQSGNWAYFVSKVDRKKEVTWTEFGNKVEAKGIWQIVQVKLKNIGKESYPINAHDFEIRDSAGVTYKRDGFNSALYSGSLKLSKLGDTFPPGVEAEVALLTDVNPDATGLRLWLVQARTAIDLGR
jgi:hypothetical protein